VQITPDRNQILVSKDIGAERWTIVLDEDRATATGNVYYPDGRPPLFIWCRPVDVNPNPNPRLTIFFFDCSGANACPASGCPNAWSLVARRIPIAGSFFLP